MARSIMQRQNRDLISSVHCANIAYLKRFLEVPFTCNFFFIMSV